MTLDFHILSSVYNKISVSNIITSYVPNGIHTLTVKRGYRAISEREKEPRGPTGVFKLGGNGSPNFIAMQEEANRFQWSGKKTPQSLGN